MTGFRTGYNGQRYEVRYRTPEGELKVMGWTDKRDGGTLRESAELHPTMNTPSVHDLVYEEALDGDTQTAIAKRPWTEAPK